jgi:hypothetical protein
LYLLGKCYTLEPHLPLFSVFVIFQWGLLFSWGLLFEMESPLLIASHTAVVHCHSPDCLLRWGSH